MVTFTTIIIVFLVFGLGWVSGSIGNDKSNREIMIKAHRAAKSANDALDEAIMHKKQTIEIMHDFLGLLDKCEVAVEECSKNGVHIDDSGLLEKAALVIEDITGKLHED